MAAKPQRVTGKVDQGTALIINGFKKIRVTFQGGVVFPIIDRAEYMDKLGPAVRERIKPSGTALAGPIDYGEYR